MGRLEKGSRDQGWGGEWALGLAAVVELSKSSGSVAAARLRDSMFARSVSQGEGRRD